MVLDQFRASHLRPILRCTVTDLRCAIPWRVGVTPPLQVTIDSTRLILRKAKKSTPYRDW